MTATNPVRNALPQAAVNATPEGAGISRAWRVVVVVVLLTVALGVGSVVTFSYICVYSVDLDQRYMSLVGAELNRTISDPQAKKRIALMKDHAGCQFWADCFEHGLLDPELARRLVSHSPKTGDFPAEALSLREPGVRLSSEHCSYTAPKASELLRVLSMRGSNRVVMFTYNSRNWRNNDKGVLCVWSDSEGAERLTFDEASSRYGITLEEWDDPAGKLFGKKTPFQHTYE
jgi:hypothetical protein